MLSAELALVCACSKLEIASVYDYELCVAACMPINPDLSCLLAGIAASGQDVSVCVAI